VKDIKARGNIYDGRITKHRIQKSPGETNISNRFAGLPMPGAVNYLSVLIMTAM